MMSRKRAWEPSEDDRLRLHIAGGGSAARASVVFRRSQGAVRARAAELGLKFPTISALRKKAAGSTPEIRG